MDKLHIVKIGGGLLSDEKLMASALSSFHALVGHKILIHGGGKQANELCEKLGIYNPICTMEEESLMMQP